LTRTAFHPSVLVTQTPENAMISAAAITVILIAIVAMAATRHRKRQ
jgi:hypothetical protein